MKIKDALISALILTLVLICPQAYSQIKGTILIVVSENARISVDGDNIGNADPDKPLKYEAEAGEHFVKAYSVNNPSASASQTVKVESGKQKVVSLEIAKTDPSPAQSNSSKLDPIVVADIDVTLPGILTVNSWKSEHPNKNYIFPHLHYAFEKGDVIVIDFNAGNTKSTNMMKVATYPDKVIKYSNEKFTELSSVMITVDERSIYQFLLSTSHAFDVKGHITIKRIPLSEQTKSFNTSVVMRKKFHTQEIASEKQYVNGGFNAATENGKSRVVIPVKLPRNTVYWLYSFSATRNKQLENEEYSLMKEITKVAGLVPGEELLSLGVEQLIKPPSSDYCDVYMFDGDNSTLFENKSPSCKACAEGRAEHLKSGIIKITATKDPIYYLGILNPSILYGINTSIQVVAITMTEELEMEQK